MRRMHLLLGRWGTWRLSASSAGRPEAGALALAAELKAGPLGDPHLRQQIAVLHELLLGTRPVGAWETARRRVVEQLLRGRLRADPGVVARADVPEATEETEAAPSPTPVAEEASRTDTFVEVALIDEDDRPIPDARCEIELPDGDKRILRTDTRGVVRIAGIPPGACKVSFIDLDEAAWQRV